MFRCLAKLDLFRREHDEKHEDIMKFWESLAPHILKAITDDAAEVREAARQFLPEFRASHICPSL